jgi:hypothetical protein
MRKVVIAGSLVLAACGAQPVQNETASDSVGPAPFTEIEQRIDVIQLLGASKSRVRALLGEPRACRREGRGESCAYGPATEPGYATEIFFVASRAARLTLPNFGLESRPESLRAYGLSAGEPDFKNEHLIRWYTSIGSIPAEIDMFPGEGRIFYLYVMARDVEI